MMLFVFFIIGGILADDSFEGSGTDWMINDEVLNILNTTTSLIIDETNFEDDYVDYVGETYDYETKVIQLFQYINGEKIYLDTSNQEIGQYIVDNEYPHRFLNIIQYSLYKNTVWDDDDQIVLRHQISQWYFCLTNCGVYYMSEILTLDCVFVRELVQDILENSLEKIYLKKRYNGNMVTINMEYGQMNFKKYATLYSQEIDYPIEKIPKMTPVLDMANADICSSKYIMHFVDEIEPNTAVNNVQGAGMSFFVLIICLTVIIVTLSVLVIITVVFRFKKRSFKLNNKI
ncbi:unknown [Cryptophlebia leucotreta granulovirus]|uniref:FGF-3 n=1 Tax=Cryptophlebia leucotreta granulosis virus TaxID=35254 RepID=Q7T5G6_GVCL|nr:hypothetical protein [Cryptophlebia leucotreta granulovirus]AAQ21722.1 unknown [Cryptophlebia leucotreta granulovirus]